MDYGACEYSQNRFIARTAQPYRTFVRKQGVASVKIACREAQKQLRRSVPERKIDFRGSLHLKVVSSAFKHRLFTSWHFRTGFDTSGTIPAAIMTAEYEQEPIPVDEVYNKICSWCSTE